MVQRSYDRDTTKGGKGAAIPLATELVAYLETAMAASPSEYVFPGPDGRMMSSKNTFEKVLRRALGRAGITNGYVHVCRKKGCGHSEVAEDNELRRCPAHGYRLWPKAQVRPIRFHDLRHSCASLLLMAGASLASVQKIMRHADPRITAEVYGHLLPDFLRGEIDRLRFGTSPAAPATRDTLGADTSLCRPDLPSSVAPSAAVPSSPTHASDDNAIANSNDLQANAAVRSGLVTTLLQAPEFAVEAPANDVVNDQELPGVVRARSARFTTRCARCPRPRSPSTCAETCTGCKFAAPVRTDVRIGARLRSASARSARFELATFGSVDRRSIQLSYERKGGQ